jgi:hypothetical protein
MQTQYFVLWLGKWPTAIDWTAAVMGTHLSAALHTLSTSFTYTMPGTFDVGKKLDVEAQMVENDINKYFSQSITYHFGEDHFGIRNQAYDDMLWVVLGWLENTKFINAHSRHHYPVFGGKGKDWYARQFVPGFAHRARVFYDLASKGWDWKLCGGGMNWNPHTKLPYKNAITNQLFIAASIGMYLDFPGDKNCSPFMPGSTETDGCSSGFSSSSSTYNPIYLQAAINGYNWLKNSNMTNAHGLYIDGFHITGYGEDGGIGTGKCDERNEMVYTYNQGVVLSGLRGLWEATGNIYYLEDGHELVRNVIRATGWQDPDISPTESFLNLQTDEEVLRQRNKNMTISTSFNGIGSHGLLTEICDPSGTCTQNGQTFKGIFFHHLTYFCTALPRRATTPGKTVGASRELALLHQNSCAGYAKWVVRNARAAMRTRDQAGRFGSWWGAGEGDGNAVIVTLPEGAVDYRNDPAAASEFSGAPGYLDVDSPADLDLDLDYGYDADDERDEDDVYQPASPRSVWDPNDRGRGRTVETQGGGVAVLRAMWEFVRGLGDADMETIVEEDLAVIEEIEMDGQGRNQEL